MALFLLLFFSLIFTLCLGFSIEASTLPQESNIGVSTYSIWPLFGTTVISGSFGGFVHALESEKTHAMKVPFDGRLADSGIWGHVFIGGCGSIVAVAVMIAIFGLDITAIASNPISTESFVNSIKTMFYISGIGIVGGYSGLPIISLISSAALKKVQRQVEALENSDAEKGAALEKVTADLQLVTGDFAKIQTELASKEAELREATLTGVLLTAESHARNGFFQEAIDELIQKYLPEDSKNPKAYHWLALCEKRLGNYQKALEYATKSLDFEKSRLGYFNLACYQYLLDFPLEQVYDSLHLAWKHAESMTDKKRLVNSLKTDDDFTKLRESDGTYQELLRQYESELQMLGG